MALLFTGFKAGSASGCGCCPGSTSIYLPGCACASLPASFYMHVNSPTKNNRIFQNATFAYGPCPSWATSLGLGASCWLSTATFQDNVTSDHFYYYFSCNNGFYFITRVYQTSVFGSPYRDSIRYRWLPNLGGGPPGSVNRCTPNFRMENGQIYSGGDRTELVTLNLDPVNLYATGIYA